MRVLITRPEDDAREIAARLVARGHEPVIAPLLAIHFFDGPEISLDDVQAILATSANGVRALARRAARRDVPVFAVGPQTAETARAENFASVRSADGDAETLAARAQAWSVPDKGVLLHATGKDSQGKLAASLTTAGYRVRVLELYEAVAADALPMDAAQRLRDGTLDAVLFFSPRTGRIFRACCTAEGLEDPCARLTAICISAVTANALAPLAFGSVLIAAAPNQEALLACLG